MESINVPILGLVIQALFLIGSVFAILWKANEKMNEKFTHSAKNQATALQIQAEAQVKAINRVYERIDEKGKEFEKTFVRVDVHNLTLTHYEQKTDEKFRTTIQTFELKLENLENAVNALINTNMRKQNG